MSRPDSFSLKRENRIICVPFAQDAYSTQVKDARQFRKELNSLIERCPELFPEAIKKGYQMKGSYLSKRLGLLIRRIEVAGVSYTVRPAFVMPYLTGLVDKAEKVLFLRKFSVPFWALAYVFGKHAMHWYRMEHTLGRQPLVGTTVRRAEDLPEHLVADEKHTRLRGDKIFVATTCAQGCLLGASVTTSAGETALTQGYGVFKTEAQQVQPDYCPDTVNTDGWQATQLAWRALFSSVVLIACFLHVYIKLRDRSKVKFKDLFQEVAERLWRCYQAPTKASFSQRFRRLCEWAAEVNGLPTFMREKIEKMRTQLNLFTAAYDAPGTHRTSNLLDRLMQRMDRHLFCMHYFHGGLVAAEYSIRAWALINNFAPSNPYTIRRYDGFKSPAERLNQFRYHDNWLQNLLISGSQKGVFTAPLNPG